MLRAQHVGRCACPASACFEKQKAGALIASAWLLNSIVLRLSTTHRSCLSTRNSRWYDAVLNVRYSSNLLTVSSKLIASSALVRNILSVSISCAVNLAAKNLNPSLYRLLYLFQTDTLWMGFFYVRFFSGTTWSQTGIDPPRWKHDVQHDVRWHFSRRCLAHYGERRNYALECHDLPVKLPTLIQLHTA